MNVLSSITDDEFVPFLKSLGIETYGKSFEWMLTDSDFSDVLRWLYTNLDHNNALTPREDYRYTEIGKKHALLSPEDLSETIASLTDQYKGLVLPGDKDALDDAKLQLTFCKERIDLLEKHDDTIEALIKQNEHVKDDLTCEIAKLNALEKQCKEEEASAAEKCLSIADEVEHITDDVVDTVADTISLYSNTHMDKDISKKFFAFGPFEAYKQSQRLFKSHFDLYTSKKFNRKLSEATSKARARESLIETDNMESSLYDGISSYVDSLMELNGVQAMIGLVVNYDNVHPSQIHINMMESKSAVELLEREEEILKRQLQHAARALAATRTRAAAARRARAARALREEIYSDLCWIYDATETALALDNILYFSLRRELQISEDLVQFAGDLKEYVLEERKAIASRMDSMTSIMSQQEFAEEKLQSADTLLGLLCDVYGTKTSDGLSTLIRSENDVKMGILKSGDVIESEFRGKQQALEAFKEATGSLRDYINDGCTKRPNCLDRTVASLMHSLRDETGKLDRKIVDTIALFTSVKTGDKHGLRKLWQWFLTDQTKLLAKVKEVQTNSYS